MIFECDADKLDKAMKIKRFGECPLTTFCMGDKQVKDVVSGVPLTVKPEVFISLVDGVREAKRMTVFREGEREESQSVCLTFEGSILPERVYLQ